MASHLSAGAVHRREMIRHQIAARGISDRRLLEAIEQVPRERFVPEELAGTAYDDAPLPIGDYQTISQPYMMAYMLQALAVGPDARVLEIGTGSGYAAAVLANMCEHVVTIERFPALAEHARALLQRLGCHNVQVVLGDGSVGYAAEAPYDGIVVAASGPEVPDELIEQLRLGASLIMPVGPDTDRQMLMKITRTGEASYKEQALAPVRFVPLVGAGGWQEHEEGLRPAFGRVQRGARGDDRRRQALVERVRRAAEPFDDPSTVDLEPLLARVGNARVVLIGSATCGSAEVHRMRATITSELIARKGFNIVALEGDWSEAGPVDAYVRQDGTSSSMDAPQLPNEAWPSWVWRTNETMSFINWLRSHNRGARTPRERVGFYGLDFYGQYSAIQAVLDHLQSVDAEAANVARQRYSCLTQWQYDLAPRDMAITEGYRRQEDDTVLMLQNRMLERLDGESSHSERFSVMIQNTKLIAEAERFYRTMYYNAAAAWNLRERHMYDTLNSLLEQRGANSRAVVWTHNTHAGDARATQMGTRGELSLGQLVRERFGRAMYSIAVSTHHGTVATASTWGGPCQVERLRPAHPRSYEAICHDTGLPAFMLPLRARRGLRRALEAPRLERAVGIIYRPETERTSHYFDAVLPNQFDELVWLDETSAVSPLRPSRAQG